MNCLSWVILLQHIQIIINSCVKNENNYRTKPSHNTTKMNNNWTHLYIPSLPYNADQLKIILEDCLYIGDVDEIEFVPSIVGPQTIKSTMDAHVRLTEPWNIHKWQHKVQTKLAGLIHHVPEKISYDKPQYHCFIDIPIGVFTIRFMETPDVWNKPSEYIWSIELPYQKYYRRYNKLIKH